MTTEQLLAECEEYLSSDTVTIDPNYRSSIRLVQSLAGHVRTLNTVLHAVEKTPRPDTARADAAERMLARIWSRLYPTTRHELRQLDDEIRRWDDANGDANERRIRINVLTAARDRHRADLAATEAKLAELAALDGGGTP